MSKISDSLKEQIARLRHEFLTTSAEQLSDICGKLVKLERSFDQSEKESIVRSIHNLKGLGATYEIPLLTTLCHNFEEEFNTLDSMTDADQFLKLVDLMLSLVNKHLEGNLSGEEESLFNTRILHDMNKRSKQATTRILFVDTSRTIITNVCRVFVQIPLKISYANDGLMALNRALNEPFDAIFFGNQLPSLSGVSCIAALKLNTSNTKAKLILMTSDEINPIVMPDQILVKDSNFFHKVCNIIDDLTDGARLPIAG